MQLYLEYHYQLKFYKTIKNKSRNQKAAINLEKEDFPEPLHPAITKSIGLDIIELW